MFNVVLALIIVGGCAWYMVDFICWDWRLRGKLTEDEYKAYQSCERFFGWRDHKYIPTVEQITAMIYEAQNDADLFRSMYNKLHEEVQL